MAFELDHVFICTEMGAPAADRLLAFGLTEGTANVHAGQGTANRRFFFRNWMLELLWVHDPNEAQSETTRPLYLWERWRDRDRGNCPFGVCLRPTGHPPESLPFSTWDYHPLYLPDSISIPVGTNAHVVTEPLLFYLPFGKRQDSYMGDQRQPMVHRAGLNEMTRLTFVSPYADQLSPELQAIVDLNLIDLQQGETYRLELNFDGETQGNQVDFQPALPLTLQRRCLTLNPELSDPSRDNGLDRVDRGR